MKTQDYVLKKFVRATSAAEALQKDTDTPVTEVFLTTDRPQDGSTHAVGFTYYPPDDGVPYEGRDGSLIQPVAPPARGNRVRRGDRKHPQP